MDFPNWKEFFYPYKQAVSELTVKFNAIIEECRELDIYSPMTLVEGRVKRPSSIMEKASRKKIPSDKIAEEIEDIAGIRIQCRFVEDINKVVTLIRRRDGKDMTILEERDYITNTKPSGYRSYHIIIRYPLNTAVGFTEVLAEIQIRTLAMNFWAVAEHSIRYKYSNNIPIHLQERLTNCAEASFNLDNEMSTIRNEIIYAQRLNEIKESLVDSIIKKIQDLYFVAKLEEMDEINKRFADIWEEGDIDKLKDFYNQLNVIAELYRV